MFSLELTYHKLLTEHFLPSKYETSVHYLQWNKQLVPRYYDCYWFYETSISDSKVFLIKCYKNDKILRMKSKNENPKNKPRFPPTLPTKPAKV